MSKNTRVTNPEVVITLFPRAAASMDEARVGHFTWKKLVEVLSEPDLADDKKKVQLMLPASFKEGAKKKELENVEEVYLGTLDVDGVDEETYENLVEWLEDEGLNALLYSTWSHTDSIQNKGEKAEKNEGPCYCLRVLLPLSRPVKAYEWKYFWEALNSHCHGLADPQCKDASRGYFVPAIQKKHKGKPEEQLFIFREFEGDGVLDVDWLLQSFEKEIAEVSGNIAANLPDQKDAHSVSKEAVRGFAKKLKAKRAPAHSLLGDKMLQAFRGEIFEAAGHRDKTLFQMAKELAAYFPKGRVSDLCKPFEAAFSAMADAAPDAPTLEDFATKILRAQSEVLAETKRKALEEEKKKLEAAREEERVDENVDHVFTEEYVKAYLERTNAGTEFENFKERLILKSLEQYYIYHGDKYVLVGKSLQLAAKRYLQAAAKPLGFSLHHIIQGEEGAPPVKKLKTPIELELQYGTFVGNVEYNLQGISYYDERKDTLHMSECLLSPLQAKEVPEVEKWIQSLGDEETIEPFRDWLSQVPDTTKGLTTLVFVGPKGIGKSSLANGLAKIWQSGKYAKMAEAFGDFSKNLLARPIVLADEKLPKDFRGRVDTEGLRAFIAAGEHDINRKNMPLVGLRGYFRGILAINSLKQLRFSDNNHSREDIEALQDRLLILDATKSTKTDTALFDYELFVNKCGLAQHVLWLHKNRQRKKARVGVVTNSYKELVFADRTVVIVLNWIMRAILARNLENLHVQPNNIPAIIVRNGKVFVNVRRVVDTWDTFKNPDDRFSASVPSVIASLGVVGKEQVELYIGNRFNKSRWWVLEEDVLVQFAQRHNFHEEKLLFMLSVYNDVSIVTPAKYKDITPEESSAREQALIALSNLYEDQSSDVFDEVAE